MARSGQGQGKYMAMSRRGPGKVKTRSRRGQGKNQYFFRDTLLKIKLIPRKIRIVIIKPIGI